MRNGTSEPELSFRRMTSGDRREAFDLLRSLLDDGKRDRARLEGTIGAALSLFIDRPDYGFVYMAFDGTDAVACATVSYAISVSQGTVAAEVEHLVVSARHRRAGVGSMLIESLAGLLRAQDVGRIDVFVATGNMAARSFYLNAGFEPEEGPEERMALRL